jgi:hypothetical protein
MRMLTVALVFSIMMPVAGLYALDEKMTLIFRESTGQNQKTVSYGLESTDDLVQIEADFEDELQKVITDTDLHTKRLEIFFPENSTVVSIRREDDRLVIDGEKTRSIEVEPEIPWYQVLLSLKGFVMSGERKTLFYTLSANFDERLSRGRGIQLLQLVARRNGEEVLEINGKKIKTVRVVVTFNDIRSLFWKAHYWYRESDGMLVRYTEVRGAPGTPETLGVLVEEDSWYD